MTNAEELNSQLGKVHDSRLISVNLQWSEGTVTVTFANADARQVIISPVTRLECPREDPWGPSEYVNGVTFAPAAERPGMQMTIQMQSGDEIVIRGGSIEIVKA